MFCVRPRSLIQAPRLSCAGAPCPSHLGLRCRPPSMFHETAGPSEGVPAPGYASLVAGPAAQAPAPAPAQQAAQQATPPQPPPGRLPRVLIVGGSMGGCCAALALGQLGCPVAVCERAAGELPTQGAGLVVQPDLASFLLRCGVVQDMVRGGAGEGLGAWRDGGGGGLG